MRLREPVAWRAARGSLRTAGPPLILGASVAIAIACGDSEVLRPPPPPADTTSGITVSVTATSSLMAPGETVGIIADAIPAERVRVTNFRVRFSGLVDTMVTIPTTNPGAVRARLDLELGRGPVEGSIIVQASASVPTGSATDETVIGVRDHLAPEITVRARDRVEPGDTVAVDVTVEENGGLTYTAIRVTGPVAYDDSMPHLTVLRSTRAVALPVPPETAVGDSLVVLVTAGDWKANVDTARFVIAITDLHPPTVSAGYEVSPADSTIYGIPVWVTGDTVRLRVTGADERGLRWLGYALPFGDRDSMAVTGTTATVSWPIVVPPHWDAYGTTLSVLATDGGGNRDTVELWASFFAGRRRPLQEIARAGMGSVSDVAYDVARQVLYLAEADSARVSVFSLQTLTYAPGLDLAFRPTGVDLSVSGDSLLLALEQTPYLGVLDLTAHPWRLDTLRLNGIDGATRSPSSVRVAADGKAFIGVEQLQNVTGSFHVVDLGTGEQTARPELYGVGRVFRSGDRSTVALIAGGNAFVYRVGDPSLSGPFNTGFAYAPEIDHEGEYALSAFALHDLRFNLVTEFFTVGSVARTFSPDGTAAYYGIDNGYVKLSVPDGSRLDHVLLLPEPSGALIATPDGATLVVLGGDRVPLAIVDLRE